MISAKIITQPISWKPIDLSRELNDCLDICKLDIQDHIKKGIEIESGLPMAPLAESTVVSKSRSKNAKVVKHAHDTLQATENLLRNQLKDKATPANQEARLYIGVTREEIAGYLQEGTPKMPARPFFAISEKASSKIDELIGLKISRWLMKIINNAA
jgi:hypothetical protein